MSGFVRTIQKSILKRAGYERQKERLVVNNGRPVIVKLKKGEGVILDPAGDSTGSRKWPTITAGGGKGQKRAFNGAYLNGRKERGRRRGKHSKAWIEARKARAG